jgi:hypothetical protein
MASANNVQVEGLSFRAYPPGRPSTTHIGGLERLPRLFTKRQQTQRFSSAKR